MILQYLKQILAKPFSIVWIVVTGFVSVASYIGIGEGQAASYRWLVVSNVSLLFLSIGLLISGFYFFRKSFDPIKIKKVIKGSHYYQDNILIILDKSP